MMREVPVEKLLVIGVVFFILGLFLYITGYSYPDSPGIFSFIYSVALVFDSNPTRAYSNLIYVAGIIQMIGIVFTLIGAVEIVNSILRIKKEGVATNSN